MKKTKLPLLALVTIMSSSALYAQLPKPKHVILVMEENYAYEEILGGAKGSGLTPTFTALSQGTYAVSFTKHYAIEHPSEPNYLDLFSGKNQGVTTDLTGQDGGPFNDCNLGASVIAAGKTFIGYSEDQPAVGTYTCNCGSSGLYASKHAPWINWINANSPYTIPTSDDLPYSDDDGYSGSSIFPDSNHYSNLPTVAWVIPNLVDDMHNGSSATTALPAGDSWFKTNMMPLVRYALKPADSTVVIVTWDEDDGGYSNHIALIVISGLLKQANNQNASYSSHYGLLRTIEDMYGLSYCGNSDTAKALPTNIWNTVTTNVNSISQSANTLTTWPVPAKNELNMNITSANEDNASISICDITGRMVKKISTQLKSRENYITVNTSAFSDGIYFLTVTGDKINICKKILIGN